MPSSTTVTTSMTIILKNINVYLNAELEREIQIKCNQ